MSSRFAGHEPADGDTAGTPWHGRTLASPGFDGDAGGASPGLLAALAEPDDEVTLVQAVGAARWIVPVLAVPGQQARSDMASVTLRASDGQRALPVFSSIEALARWDDSARPVPVTAQRAALAAVQEGCQVIVIDVGSAPTVALRGSMVWALAMGRGWGPPHTDEQVRSAVGAACRTQDSIQEWALVAGPHGALVIELVLVPGLAAAQIQAVVTAVGERIAVDGEVRARIDAVSFRLRDQ